MRLEHGQHNAFMADRSALGVLLLKGETRLTLINRMSTNDVVNLGSGEGAATVLTSDIGRMIDRLFMYATSDSVYVLTGEDNADNIARYLLRFVFFNDDFHLQNIGSETAIWAVYGTGAAAGLTAAGFGETDLPLHHWKQVEIAGATAYLHKTDPILGDGYFVMCGEVVRPKIAAALQAAGVEAVDATTFEADRIASGLPRFGREITLDYIPLEAGLWGDVSFNKGCYTGQEIIARMESRGKLAKQLVRLRTEGVVEAGSDVSANGKKVGTVTSSAETVALAYVKTSALDADLAVGDRPVQLVG